VRRISEDLVLLAIVFHYTIHRKAVGGTSFGAPRIAADRRLLELAMRRRTVSDLIDQLRVPKRYGLLLAATCGLLMFCCKAEEYYYNVFFPD
jgi:hypothetical protein